MSHSFRPLILVSLLLLAGLLSAEAQVSVRARVTRKLFLAGENVWVEITMTNLAGREITLTSMNGTPWLGFDVRTTDGERLTARRNSPQVPDLIMAAGETLTRTISLSNFYPLGDAGDYTARAWVYFADAKDYMYSGNSRFTVAPGRTIWSQTVGVPLSESGGGQYRTYELQSLQDTEKISIYALIKDKESNRQISCFTLGSMVKVVNPQAAIDQANQLHVLFMTAPQVLQHTVIRYDGSHISTDKFRVTDRYPRLMRSSTGQVGVSGGVKLKDAPPLTDPVTGEAMAPPMLSDRPD